jgi:hypothetical protein
MSVRVLRIVRALLRSPVARVAIPPASDPVEQHEKPGRKRESRVDQDSVLHRRSPSIISANDTKAHHVPIPATTIGQDTT